MTSPALIYISLGSNIDPEVHLLSALNILQSTLNDAQVSTIYRSAAVGMQGADFLNAVAAGHTTESPASVIQWLKELELQHHRVRSANKFTDRTLDLDLLLYNDAVTEAVPHHEIATQAYVLQPLCELAPALVHPALQRSIADLRAQLMQAAPHKFSSLTPVQLN